MTESRLARKPPPPIPVVVLTGFLGAGKTTLLNDLLRDGALADTVVLINEFGDVGLDHLLVERVDGDMLLMASGCLCCTIRGDLVNTLEGLLRRRDNGRIAPFVRILIETTGLADPVPVLQTLIGHPYFALRFRLDRVVTVVDAVNGFDTLARHREAVRQVALADCIVVTKTDLPETDTPALRTSLAPLAPTATILDRARGEADAKTIFGVARQASAARLPADAPAHDHDHAHAHHHDVSRHGETICSHVLVRDAPVAPAALQLFLDIVRHAHGPRLLRMKGFVALADDPARPLVLHAVQHLLHPPVRLDAWPDDDHRTRIVVITNGLDQAVIESLFAAVCGDLAPDRPDRAALAGNPLVPGAPSGLLA